MSKRVKVVAGHGYAIIRRARVISYRISDWYGEAVEFCVYGTKRQATERAKHGDSIVKCEIVYDLTPPSTATKRGRK